MTVLDERDIWKKVVRRQINFVAGITAFTVLGLAIASLATWNVDDPSFSLANGNDVQNALGYPGAVFADLAMQFFGIAALFALVPISIWASRLVRGQPAGARWQKGAAWFLSIVLLAAAFGCFAPPQTWPLPNGMGGVFGDLILRLVTALTGTWPAGPVAVLLGAVFGIIGVALLFSACSPATALENAGDIDQFEDGDFDEGRSVAAFVSSALGAVTHHYLSVRAGLRRMGLRTGTKPGQKRAEPELFEGESARRDIGHDEFAFDDEFGEDDIDDDDPVDADLLDSDAPFRFKQEELYGTPRANAPASAKASPPRKAGRASARFQPPSIDMLVTPPSKESQPSLSKEMLAENAQLLESVLEDFGVRGEIVDVLPGPVVTMYELEPAPGIKSSRVIGLADDIARSMSAIAARVAVVPGRNAIGIELPNERRETVYLRELMAARDFAKSKASLALALGKTIDGKPIIADLAKMPHLLVAGTTGSGKSVAINTMILSLLYRMSPQECRLIMIDPKMLELSIYDGIPHLLTPVVTDPKKAVVALKWAVREMEDRYRKMSKVGVRNIDGFNARVRDADKKGEKITRTVQTGFDRDTGEAIYESEDLDLSPLPYIVVLIDEMADLMMVAGKDIEGAVQRLAQMARAAGIHVIMATQRPSVDVITGTIKANFPTRISFQVTSKIDSRTILGEQGAEQLLGMGDMLYMAGGGRTQRVHGPFVGDDEVEAIVAHLKTQGVPEYLDAVTEDDEEEFTEGGSNASGGSNGSDDDADPYDQAVSVVLRDNKVSTSYIQRRLGIGYNRAASIVERMEEEGVIGPANHAGKREILAPVEDENF